MKVKGNRSKLNRSIQMAIESLEGRRLMTTSVWTGSAGDHLYSDAGNWQDDTVPASGNDIEFNNLGSAQAVDFGSGATVGNLYISGTYSFSGGNVTLLGDVETNESSTSSFSNTLVPQGQNGDHFTSDTDATMTLAGVDDSANVVLDKYGAGTLVLSGNSDNGNWQLLEHGTTDLTGATQANISIYGGTLVGNGSADSVSTDQGSFAPSIGSTPSTITTDNTYFDQEGTYAVTLDSSSSYTQIQSNGPVAFNNNPTLSVALPSGFSATAGTVFTIIHNASGSANTGTFNGFAEGATVTAGTTQFQISYIGGTSGHDVTLTALSTTTGTGTTTTGPTITTPATATANTAKQLKLTATATESGSSVISYVWTLVKGPSGRTPIILTPKAQTTNVNIYKDGTYHFRVTATDTAGHSTTSDVDYVMKQKPRLLKITPAAGKVTHSKKVTFSTIALDQFDDAMRVNTTTTTYKVVSGGGTITAAGVFTAPSKKGKVVIEVALDGVTDEFTETII